MQRAFFALLGILLVGIGIVPTAAQSGSIADIIDSRTDLSTLSVFLDAADPAVRDTLASSGSYTFFAPNNIAFQNLSSLLEIPLQDLLQNPEIVTQIIQYHLIDGAYDSNGVAQLSGQVIPTQLQGAFVGVRLNDDDVITINNVVEIEQANIRASNGYVHIVNDVLLNRLIAAAVDNVNLESAITPNPFSETDTPTPEPTAEPTRSSDLIAVGNIRFTHLVPDAESVDVYINETILFEDIAFTDVTKFISLQPATYNVAVTPVNTSLTAVIIGPIAVTVADGDFITIAAVGSAQNDRIDVALLEEDYSPPAAETSRFTIYHAIEDAPSIDVMLDDDTVLSNISSGESATVDIATGIYEIETVRTDDTDTGVLQPQRVSLWDGSYYFAVIAGTSDEPQLIIQSIRIDEADELREGLALEGGDVSTENILDTLEAHNDFSILIAALEAADEDVINRLGASIQEPVTLLAPTDRAFENLFTTLGMSQDTFLSNTDLVTDILLYHVIESEILASDFRAAAGTSIITMLPDNQAFFVTVTDNGTVLLNGFVQFEQVDILTSNGVIHVIENVLLPQSAVRQLGL